MAVAEVGEKFRCNICGNEVVATEVGGEALVCCGEDMERIENTPTDFINCLIQENSENVN